MRYITNEPISGEKALLTFLSNLYGKKSFVDWPNSPGMVAASRRNRVNHLVGSFYLKFAFKFLKFAHFLAHLGGFDPPHFDHWLRPLVWAFHGAVAGARWGGRPTPAACPPRPGA